MRVAFISHSSALRGGERALLELLIGLHARGVSCFVIFRQPGEFVDKLKELGIPTAILPFGWWIASGPWWKRPLREALTLATLLPVIFQLKKWRVDLIFTNTVGPPVGALAAAVLRLPHVWFLHEFGWKDHGLTFDFGIKFSASVIGRLSRRVITNSEAVRTYYSTYISPEKLKCVYQAVELPARENSSDDSRGDAHERMELSLVGALHEAKGHREAIAALSHLLGDDLCPTLNFVGTGRSDYVALLKRQVADAGLQEKVRFIGEVPDPTALISASRIVLMCSRAEAFGRVTIEAMKLGKPVIGARSGATPELIREGFNGLLYTPGDPVDLASKIRLLILDSNLAEQMGSNGQAWASKRFTIEAYSDEILKVLTSAIDSTR